MIDKITINGVTYHVTPTTAPQLGDQVVTIDGVIYVIGDPLVEAQNTSGDIERARVGGQQYDIRDAVLLPLVQQNATAIQQNTTAIANEKTRAEQAEQTINESLTTVNNNLATLNTTIVNYNRKYGIPGAVSKTEVVAKIASGTAVDRGMIVTYYAEDGWHTIQYKLNYYNPTEGAKESNWVEIGGGGESSYTLPIATSDTLGGVKSYPREGEIYSDPNGPQYAVVVTESGRAHVTVPYAGSNNSGVVRLENIVKNHYNAVSGKAVVEYVDEAEKRALRKLYIAAGAEYNDTDQIIKKTAFWGEEVDHLPKHYYLNGLGDITEEEMSKIYQEKEAMCIILTSPGSVSRYFQDYNAPRTLIPHRDYRYAMNRNLSSSYVFQNGIEVIKWCAGSSFANSNDSGMPSITNAQFLYSTKDVSVIDSFKSSASVNLSKDTKLKEFRVFAEAPINLYVSSSKVVSKNSLLHFIENMKTPSAATTSAAARTIMLHPDVYAKCIEGGEWYEEINTALVAKNESLSAKNYSLNIASA